MPVTIHELRPDEVDKASAFATTCGCQLQPGRIVPALSLVIAEGEDLAAVLLCIEQPNDRHRLELGHAGDGLDEEQRRRLIDKSLMKLRAAGVRTCDLATNGAASDASFWGSVSWLDQLGDAA